MIALHQLGGGVDQLAIAMVDRHIVAGALDPVLELSPGVAGMGRFQSLPEGLGLGGRLLDAGNDQIVLRAEMTIERHLVAVRSVGDRVDPDPANAVLPEEVARSIDDPVPGPGQPIWQE